VFADLRRRPHDYTALRRRALAPAVKAAGLPPMGFHALRRTATTELLHVGVPLKQLQEWLGHHDPAHDVGYAKARPGDVAGLDALYRARDAARERSRDLHRHLRPLRRRRSARRPAVPGLRWLGLRPRRPGSDINLPGMWPPGEGDHPPCPICGPAARPVRARAAALRSPTGGHHRGHPSRGPEPPALAG
jgi:Phage integrase family